PPHSGPTTPARTHSLTAAVGAAGGDSADLAQIDREDQRLVWADRPRALGPVAEVGRDDEQPAAALLHADHALVPAGVDHAGGELDRGRLVARPRGVDLLAVGPRVARVVHRQLLAGLRLRALALDDVLDHQLRGRIALGHDDLGLLL